MSPSSSSEPNLPDKPFDESSFVEIDGMRLHLRTWHREQEASSLAVLLLHGFGGSTFSWRHIGPALMDLGFRTIAVDLPGAGYSERYRGPQTAGTQVAELLWHLTEHIDAQTANAADSNGQSNEPHWVLIGHSLGARVAAAMAALQPRRVRRLVLVDAVMYGQPAAVPLLGFAPLRWFVGLWARNQLLTEKGMTGLLESAYGRAPTAEEVSGYLEPLLSTGSAAGLLRTGSWLPTVGAEEMQKITARCLIIWGEQDGWVDVKNALRIFNDLPSAEIYIVVGGGHAPMETHVDDVMTRLTEFLMR